MRVAELAGTEARWAVLADYPNRLRTWTKTIDTGGRVSNWLHRGGSRRKWLGGWINGQGVWHALCDWRERKRRLGRAGQAG